MRLFKQQDSNFFVLHDVTDQQLISLFNICLNYKPYIENLLSMPDKQLLAFAPGTDGMTVRQHLLLQLKTCEEYIKFWQSQIETKPQTDPDVPQA